MAGEGERVQRTWIRSSDSPSTTTSAKGASGTGLEKVSGPPHTTSGLAIVAFLAEQGQPGELEHVEDAGELQLVADRERKAGELRHRLLRLVRAERHPRVAPGGDVVRQERPLGGRVIVRVDLANRWSGTRGRLIPTW